MKFRAILIDPGNKDQERPIQICGNDRTAIDRWAYNALEHAVSSAARVEVWEISETRISTVKRSSDGLGTGGAAGGIS
jgi:hypothetical protein